MRRKTNKVRIGNLILSSDQAVMVQSMLNTPTMDTEACVEQAIRIIEADGQLVRITAPGIKEAENLKNIHKALCDKGYTTPLSADIHFVREAALVAAEYVEKVRINPGNFVDKRATFKELIYTDEAYAAELEILKQKFAAFLEVCKANHTAVRIGTNHGSLSDRIMSRYGNTPAGMVEATMEYLRVCKATGFENVVISLKSSDCRVMVDAVRLLVRQMEREGMPYPLHLGVTEAGEGEDGRIRSAVGIGTLLNEGIGDTIRVSLTEAPEAEIPVAKQLVRMCNRPLYEKNATPLKGECSRPAVVAELPDLQPLLNEYADSLDFIPTPEKEGWQAGIKAPEILYTEVPGPWLSKLPEETTILVPSTVWKEAILFSHQACPLFGNGDFHPGQELPDAKRIFIRITSAEQADEKLVSLLEQTPHVFLVLTLGEEYHVYRKAFRKLAETGLTNRAFVHGILEGSDRDEISLMAASRLGGLFLDRLPAGLWLSTPGLKEQAFPLELSRNILQSAGVRRYKAEFISCPGCGRTLFDLQGAVAKVKKAFAHLNTLKIAVMGCVVNGPGEMGDADYGYVGAGNGKVNLYKGRKMVRAALPEDQAIEALRELIENK